MMMMMPSWGGSIWSCGGFLWRCLGSLGRLVVQLRDVVAHWQLVRAQQYKVIYGGSLWRCSGSFLMRHGGSVEAHCVHWCENSDQGFEYVSSHREKSLGQWGFPVYNYQYLKMLFVCCIEQLWRHGGDGPGRAGLAVEPAGAGPALHPLLQGLLHSHQVPHPPLHTHGQAHRRDQGQYGVHDIIRILTCFRSGPDTTCRQCHEILSTIFHELNPPKPLINRLW